MFVGTMAEWRNLPEDLQFKILACFSLASLLKLRRVCRTWYSSLQNQEFHKLWARCNRLHQFHLYHDFIKRILQAQTASKVRHKLTVGFDGCAQEAYAGLDCYELISCMGGFLLTSNISGPKATFHVLNPSKALVKQLPGCKAHLGLLIGAHSKIYFPSFWPTAVGMVMHSQLRQNYSVFVTSKALHFRDYKRCLDEGLRISNLHLPIAVLRYDSDDGLWRWCGTISQMNSSEDCVVEGVSTHQDRYVILVRITIGETSRYQVMRNQEQGQGWEGLPGEFPSFGFKSPLLFDHDGGLFLAILFMNACAIWQYQDKMSEWVLFDEVRVALFENDFPEEEMTFDCPLAPSAYANEFLEAQQSGNFLCFGRHSPSVTLHSAMKKYNLVTRSCENVTLEELKHKLMKLPDGRSIMYAPTD